MSPGQEAQEQPDPTSTGADGPGAERGDPRAAPGRPTVSEAEELAQSTPGNRLSAFLYDRILWLGERSGMRERRARLVGEARGDVLELGAGTGLNLEHYPASIESLTLTEPEANMARRLEQRLERLGREARVLRAPAEALPFDDASFDTVVATLVLCTVPDPEAALAEIKRVLRPDGELLLLEHVRADEPRLARWQDRLHGPWKAFGDGCNCNRPTPELVAGQGFELDDVERSRWKRMPPIVKPLFKARARPA